jgi:hypothetical protein
MFSYLLMLKVVFIVGLSDVLVLVPLGELSVFGLVLQVLFVSVIDV